MSADTCLTCGRALEDEEPRAARISGWVAANKPEDEPLTSDDLDLVEHTGEVSCLDCLHYEDRHEE